MSEQKNPTGDARQEALARLKRRREFQNHLVAYIVINAAVWVISGRPPARDTRGPPG